MRIQIKADGVKTDDLRALMAALAGVGFRHAEVGLDGPECWRVETPKMIPNQWAQVAAALIKVDGRPLTDIAQEAIVSGHDLAERAMLDAEAARMIAAGLRGAVVVTATVHEPNEWLRIETGVPGDEQAASHANGTLQTVSGHELEFTVECHVGLGAGIDTEEKLVTALLAFFGRVVDAFEGEVAFSIVTGPAGRDEEEVESCP